MKTFFGLSFCAFSLIFTSLSYAQGTTYVFTGTSPSASIFNGSTITFTGDTLSSWDFVDTGNGEIAMPPLSTVLFAGPFTNSGTSWIGQLNVKSDDGSDEFSALGSPGTLADSGGGGPGTWTPVAVPEPYALTLASITAAGFISRRLFMKRKKMRSRMSSIC